MHDFSAYAIEKSSDAESLLKNNYYLDTPIDVQIGHIEFISEFVAVVNGKMKISFVFNQDEAEGVVNEEITHLTLQQCYKDIYYNIK
ncbi:hypothetical protein ECANGB1_480 [Enterospora canceri]|uniref:Uncharacterized protein n=1 Tax=Enterospora canceri TaxID=1081671 RepID=A0A1Y1S8S3_9MICR|nr:hypothetical protein ECANGB1_480 [Enterospora canceri]